MAAPTLALAFCIIHLISFGFSFPFLSICLSVCFSLAWAWAFASAFCFLLYNNTNCQVKLLKNVDGKEDGFRRFRLYEKHPSIVAGINKIRATFLNFRHSAVH